MDFNPFLFSREIIRVVAGDAAGKQLVNTCLRVEVSYFPALDVCDLAKISSRLFAIWVDSDMNSD